MANFFPTLPVLPPLGKLTAFYRSRKSITEMSPPSKLDDSTDSLPAHNASDITRMSMSLTTKGLLNPTGENNCFLNSTVQVLWHIDVFRRSFREVKGHHCVGKSCIFCSLKSLFAQFQHSPGQSAIPPDSLRQAMAVCYEGQRRFQLGLMDDAAECFEKILEQIHYHLTGSEDMDTCSSSFCLSHEKFALTVLERTECKCGATSEPLSFVQFVHYVSSSALVKEAQRIKALNSSPERTSHQSSFSRILNAASAFGESRPCTNFAKCKQNVVTKRILLNSPDVFCLGLIWDSASPSVEDIMSVVNSIGLSLRLNELFDHVFSDSAQCNLLELTAIIAYYGRHYSTFCHHSKLKEWIYFDDAKYRTIGSDWSIVCEQIRKAHYQPLLLVYTNPFGEAVDLSGAPTEVIFSPSTTPHADTLSPVEEEDPEEIFQTNQIVDNVQASSQASQVVKTEAPITMATDQGTTATKQVTSAMIDPMTLSIVPSSHRQVPTHQTTTTSDQDLMMFSLSPSTLASGKAKTSASAKYHTHMTTTTTPPDRNMRSKGGPQPAVGNDPVASRPLNSETSRGYESRRVESSMTTDVVSGLSTKNNVQKTAPVSRPTSVTLIATAHPHTSTAHPHTSTPHPHVSTPHPHTSTPHPHTSTPRNHTSTPHPHTSTPRNHSSAPSPCTSAPHPHTSAPHPHSSAPHLHTSTPHHHSSTPHPHTSTPHPHTGQAPLPVVSSHQSVPKEMVVSHRLPPTPTPSYPSTLSQDGTSIARPRPKPSSHVIQENKVHVPGRIRVQPKSNVCVGETHVQAERHAYQKHMTDVSKQNQTASDDLMTFSISPVTLATKQTNESAHVRSEVPNEAGADNEQDLIKFSITPKDVARIRNKHAKNVQTPSHYPQGLSHEQNMSRDSHVMSHDQRVTQDELNPKWDHFAGNVSETTFGTESSKGHPLREPIVSDKTIRQNVGVVSTNVGGVLDADHWAVLSMVGAEKILSPDGVWILADTQGSQTTKDTPAIKSLKRVASFPGQSQLSTRTTGPTDVKIPSPVGKTPPVLQHNPAMVGKAPTSDSVGKPSTQTSGDPTRSDAVTTEQRPNFSKRQLPDIPVMSIPRAQPKDNHTGTYVELDFDHTSERKKERPKLSEAADRDMNTTYAEISFHRKGEQKGKDVWKSPSDSETPVARCSDQPITEDPLYAVPEKVKLRKLYPKAGFDDLSASSKSLLLEARDLLAKADALEDSDNTVALMLLTQYKSLLDKVLRDPVVMANSTLRQQIRMKQEEGVRRCNLLKPSHDVIPSESRSHGKCSRCGIIRDIDPEHHLCGPCTLRVKIEQQ